MKNIQKILLAVLSLVFVAVVIIIVVVKTDKDEKTTQHQNTTQYTISGENGNSQAENNTIFSQQTNQNNTLNNEDVIENTMASDKQNSSASSNKTDTNSTQTSKKYDFSDSEVLESQRSSFGDTKLISAKYNGEKIYLFEATVDNRKFYYELPGHYNIENIYYANVDGFYGDEIIIHSDTRQYGIYDNVVLKITKDGILPLLDKEQMLDFLMSYNSILKKDFNVEIINSYTGIKKTVNVYGINEENYDESYWNSDGSIAETDLKDRVWFYDFYYSFVPNDVDTDGLYELICSQKASLGAYNSIIGHTVTTLKYNIETKEFEVMKTEFYPE